MPIAAHRCVLKYVSGQFTSLSAATELVSGNVYATKQVLSPGPNVNLVLDPKQNQALNDGGSPYGGTFTVNHLAGQFTLSAPPSGVLTVNAKYLQINTAAEVREFTINLTRDELEDTVFGDNDKTFTTGLFGATGTIGGLELLSTLFLTGTLQDRSIEDVFNNEFMFVLDVYLNRDTRRGFRAFVKIPNLDVSGARDGLVESTFNWTMSEVTALQSITGKASYAFFTHQA